jgi:hypothetical protein
MRNSVEQKMFASISGWQQSGLSQKAWCVKHSITYSVFHYWYKKFRDHHSREGVSTAAGFVQMVVPNGPSDVPWCELVINQNRKLVFHQPLNIDFIRSLID